MWTCRRGTRRLQKESGYSSLTRRITSGYQNILSLAGAEQDDPAAEEPAAESENRMLSSPGGSSNSSKIMQNIVDSFRPTRTRTIFIWVDIAANGFKPISIAESEVVPCRNRVSTTCPILLACRNG